MLKKSSKEVATSLQGRLDRLTPLSATCCIYRVPQKLRKVNMEAYTPRVVSIGPLHHGEEHLIAMEEHKLRYLQNFLHRTRKTLEECRINMSSKEFVEMILVDGCFIIEVILGFQNWNRHTIKPDDRIFNKPWLIFDVRRDMTLLENQLPFFLLLSLYSLRAPPGPLPEYQNDYAHYSFLLLSANCFIYLPLLPWLTKPSEGASGHPLGSKEKPLLDIDYRDGVLEIPKLILADACESLFRNLIAFEQCHYREDTYITDYIYLMDHLINTTKDVDILVNKGIIDNWLGDNVAVTDLFNNLLINATLWGRNFYFAGIFEGLNAYCDVPWHSWKATLRHDYFSSPWRGASTSAAVILLLLTLIQTIFSGMSAK
ncbi:hypothetical protein AAG906_006620 [Vitis piasezkii]